MDYVKNIDLSCCLSLLLVVCTQRVEEFKTPVAGEYKLECWGARGGKRLNDKDAYPGNGGYSRGTKKFGINNSIYICVGQTRNTDGDLSYNNRPDDITSCPGGPTGGGATSLTITNRGELKYFSDPDLQSEVLIVAGGGGSCVLAGQGGAGGGLRGIDGKTNSDNVSPNGTGGKQGTGGITGARSEYIVSSHGKFGVGGFGYSPNWGGSGPYGSQGGSGWYGGGGSAYVGAAGGGSSYIDGVDNGVTKNGNEKMPDPFGGDDITGNSGNGYCVISWFL